MTPIIIFSPLSLVFEEDVRFFFKFPAPGKLDLWVSLCF